MRWEVSLSFWSLWSLPALCLREHSLALVALIYCSFTPVDVLFHVCGVQQNHTLVSEWEIAKCGAPYHRACQGILGPECLHQRSDSCLLAVSMQHSAKHGFVHHASPVPAVLPTACFDERSAFGFSSSLIGSSKTYVPPVSAARP